MAKAVTRGVEVQVESFFLPAQSEPEEQVYSFAYRVKLRNLGEETVQLISRHWVITDSNGQQRNVQGPGVVGEQPVLAPGESFEYVSGSQLETPVGTMEGTYQMVNGEGDPFDVQIPMFTLSVPGTYN